MATFSEIPQYSPELNNLFSIAFKLHNTQQRKDGTPYLAHLLAVASEGLRLGSFIGQGELTSLAGVFHDTLEDIPGMTEGYLEGALGLEGPRIINIVKEVSEDNTLDKEERKEAYAKSIEHMSLPAFIVSLADKYDNLLGYINLSNVNHNFNKEEVINFYTLLMTQYKVKAEMLPESLFKNNIHSKLQSMELLWEAFNKES